jgi:hypothetical protein
LRPEFAGEIGTWGEWDAYVIQLTRFLWTVGPPLVGVPSRFARERAQLASALARTRGARRHGDDRRPYERPIAFGRWCHSGRSWGRCMRRPTSIQRMGRTDLGWAECGRGRKRGGTPRPRIIKNAASGRTRRRGETRGGALRSAAWRRTGCASGSRRCR